MLKNYFKKDGGKSFLRFLRKAASPSKGAPQESNKPEPEAEPEARPTEQDPQQQPNKEIAQ